MKEADPSTPFTVAPTSIPYDSTAIEAAVRGILKNAPSVAIAKRHLLIMNGQHSAGKILDTPIVRFENGGRSASFSLTPYPDDPAPMQINVFIEDDAT